MKSEYIALGVVVVLVLGLPALVFGYQAWRSTVPGVTVIDLVGYAPDAGGWQPENIRVNLGERVRMRIHSPDVVHGFAVPGLGLDVPEIYPGKVEEIEFTATQAGRFPFACTRWCSKDHWRMRGEIEVVDPNNPNPVITQKGNPPLYQQLDLDLDAMREPVVAPEEMPSAARGRALGMHFPPEMTDPSWLRAFAPVDAFNQLQADPVLKKLSDKQKWDLVAYLWEMSLQPASFQIGRDLYARDCAACHGETGMGDGPAGRELPGLQFMHPDMQPGPTNFTDKAGLYSASDALLQGKILRGGMGTGMPEWGSLYTDDEIWAVVTYIRFFSFEKR